MAANVKAKKVAPVQPKWPRLRGLRAVVQEGISPSDTVLRLQCRKCAGVEEMNAQAAMTKKGELVATALAWIDKAEAKHRKCGLPPGTKGVTQRLF